MHSEMRADTGRYTFQNTYSFPRITRKFIISVQFEISRIISFRATLTFSLKMSNHHARSKPIPSETCFLLLFCMRRVVALQDDSDRDI